VKQVDAAEDTVERPLTLARPAPLVVQERGTVNADAEDDVVFAEEVAPSRIDQGGIGLK
jgi:hypothetical protein